MLGCIDTLIGFECCEELWGPVPPHVSAFLQGAMIISNGSSSYHQKEKRERRISLLRDATGRQGGIYLYANQIGCDGGRVVFDGGSLICMNGEVLVEGPRFGLEEVVVNVVTIDLSLVHAFRRASPTISRASASLPSHELLPVIHVDFQVSTHLPTTPMSTNLAITHIIDINNTNIKDRSNSSKNSSNSSNIRIGSESDDEAEEMAAAASLWLWDYLRRSGARGFFLPLSGGADSACVLLLLSYMCHSLIKTIQPAVAAAAAATAAAGCGGGGGYRGDDNDDDDDERGPMGLITTTAPAAPPAAAAAAASAETAGAAAERARGVGEGSEELEEDVVGLMVLRQLEGLIGVSSTHASFPRDARTLSFHLIHTAYLSSKHSSTRTKDLSNRLAKDMGAYHMSAAIDTIAAAVVSVFRCLTNWEPRFQSDGGTREEDLALQNIQARIRMVFSYLLAQLIPLWRQKRKQQEHQQENEVEGGGVRGGSLLVVGTGNADETLRGYLTKYDCSSADLNPIGSLSKRDIYTLLSWGASPRSPFNNPIFKEIMDQRPSAELRPGEESGSRVCWGLFRVSGVEQIRLLLQQAACSSHFCASKE
ncbi:hypothetical protein ACSSS7_007890 [Eimeria intestinalis]